MLARSVVIAGLAACLGGCGNDNVTGPDYAIELTEADSGGSFRVGVGQEVIVTLASNPSTGYSWTWVCAPADALAAAGEPEYIPSAGAPRVGVGGSTRFRFTTQRAGTATLRLEYRRAFEPGSPAAKAVAYGFVVH